MANYINEKWYCTAIKCVIPGYCTDKVLEGAYAGTAKFRGLPYTQCRIAACSHRCPRRDDTRIFAIGDRVHRIGTRETGTVTGYDILPGVYIIQKDGIGYAAWGELEMGTEL